MCGIYIQSMLFLWENKRHPKWNGRFEIQRIKRKYVWDAVCSLLIHCEHWAYKNSFLEWMWYQSLIMGNGMLCFVAFIWKILFYFAINVCLRSIFLGRMHPNMVGNWLHFKTNYSTLFVMGFLLVETPTKITTLILKLKQIGKQVYGQWYIIHKMYPPI